MINCSCNKCGAIVSPQVKFHFISKDGRILCDSCSIGMEPCSDKVKRSLLKYQEEK